MGTIQTFSFGEDFIKRLVSYLDNQYGSCARDLSRVAIVFGGKRPNLFVKREWHLRNKDSFYPPRFYSMDEMINYTLRKVESFTTLPDLEQCYLLFSLAQKHAPHVLKNRESFAHFLPWAREILSFIDHLDLEEVTEDRLHNIKANAQVGYAVPEEINRLLENVVALRNVFHAYMKTTKNYTRGYVYRCAADAVVSADFKEFDEIIFCNLFHLHQSEARLIKNLRDRGLASLLFQGDEKRWATLKRTAAVFNCKIDEGQVATPAGFDLKLYSAFDGHSQVAAVREILKKIESLERTVIVLPDPELIIPLVSQINPIIKDFNISMGYPLKRSSLYSLLDFIFKAQLSRDGKVYYAKDLLRVLRHPLVKNLDFGYGAAATRVLIHKIEEMFNGVVPGDLNGQLFLTLDDLLSCEDLFALTEQTLSGMGFEVQRAQIRDAFTQILDFILLSWESVDTVQYFARCLNRVMKMLLEKSFLRNYPLNLKITEKILQMAEQMQTVSFREELFNSADIVKIFTAQMEREIVAFQGSPLNGLQILGLFETRSLNFDHVIVLNANEGVLPRLSVYEPLIPREVMISLNLDRLETEEEMQRYQFMRLISGAKSVHLIYEENTKKERSRFVEELVWEQQKNQADFNAVPVYYPSFRVQVSIREQKIFKTPAMIAFLRQYRFSSSSLNTYLRSPVEFYYSYVLGLKEKENLLEEPENLQVGTCVHAVLEDLFKLLIGENPVLDMKKKKIFHKICEEKFFQVFGKGRSSDAFMLKKVMDVRWERFYAAESDRLKRDVKEIMFIEKTFEEQIPLSCGLVHFVYRVDRVDRMKDGTMMILDYKTGSLDPMPRKMTEIQNMTLSRENIRDKVISFQIPLYFHYLNTVYKDQPINAAYYNLRTLDIDRFIDGKMTFSREDVNAVFLRPLNFIMEEIFDPTVPFCDGVKSMAVAGT